MTITEAADSLRKALMTETRPGHASVRGVAVDSFATPPVIRVHLYPTTTPNKQPVPETYEGYTVLTSGAHEA